MLCSLQKRRSRLRLWRPAALRQRRARAGGSHQRQVPAPCSTAKVFGSAVEKVQAWGPRPGQICLRTKPKASSASVVLARRRRRLGKPAAAGALHAATAGRCGTAAGMAPSATAGRCGSCSSSSGSGADASDSPEEELSLVLELSSVGETTLDSSQAAQATHTYIASRRLKENEDTDKAQHKQHTHAEC